MNAEQTTTPRIGLDKILEVPKDVDLRDLYEAIYARVDNAATVAAAGVHIESIAPLYQNYFGAIAHPLCEATDLLGELYRRAILPMVKVDPQTGGAE